MTSLLPKSSTGRIWDQKTLSPYFNFVNNVSMYSCIGRWITFPDFIIDFLFRELLWHAKDTKHLWANDVIKHQPFRRKEIMIIWIFLLFNGFYNQGVVKTCVSRRNCISGERYGSWFSCSWFRLINFLKCMFILYLQTITHQIWYDDPQSLVLKYNISTYHGLRGVGMWNADAVDFQVDPQGAKKMWDALPNYPRNSPWNVQPPSLSFIMSRKYSSFSFTNT